MPKKARKGPPSGRPKKDTDQLRPIRMSMRVRRDERHLLEQLARDANKTLSEYLRDAALTARVVIKRYRRVEPMLLHELSQIGNNLNQIARICNTTGNDRRAEYIEAFIDELRPVLKRL